MSFIMRVKPVLAAAAILLTLTGSVALAEGDRIAPVRKDAPAVERVNPDGTISLEGVVEYVDLEGGYYKVGEWSLMGNLDFAEYLGKQVVLSGKRFDGMSIRMVKSLVIGELSLKTEEAPPVLLEPVAAGSSFAVEGTLEYTDLEGGIYTVDGWGLLGDEALFKALQGKRAIVRGTQFTGISIYQMKLIEVASVNLPIAADHSLPGTVTVNGQELATDQAPLVVDGTLMVPLRHVVEAAGGMVQWDAQEQAAFVSMPGRHAFFWIGQNEAEMNQENVRYIRRNMLPMTKAPVIVNGRTMISADALTAILGLYEVGDTDPASLDLTLPQ